MDELVTALTATCDQFDTINKDFQNRKNGKAAAPKKNKGGKK